jgi:succinate-acetate transporter protein
VSASPPVRVFLRPLGTPLTVGMAGLAVASFVQSGLDLGWVPRDQTRDVGLILIAVPFVLQLIACVVAYLARDGATGATVGLLSTSWLSLGLIHIVSRPGSTNAALGLLLLIVGAMLALSAAAVSVTKPLPAVIFALAGARFALAAIYELSAVSFWQSAAGVLGLFITAGAGYCVLAFDLEDQRHHAVLPTLRRDVSPLSESQRGPDPLEGLAHEAGVRRPS